MHPKKPWGPEGGSPFGGWGLGGVLNPPKNPGRSPTRIDFSSGLDGGNLRFNKKFIPDSSAIPELFGQGSRILNQNLQLRSDAAN